METLVDSFSRVMIGATHHMSELFIFFIGSLVAFAATVKYMHAARHKMMERNVCGIDLNKTTAEERQHVQKQRRLGRTDDDKVKKYVVPEALGILAGAVYLTVLIIQVLLTGMELERLSGAFTTITVMLLLGFVDDVLDVRWRNKLFLSAVGSLPLILSYKGSTSILIPTLFQPYAGSTLINLGQLYLVYLSLLCIFCTNSINIVAGVNGVEVGQSLVIAIFSVVYGLLQLRLEADPRSEAYGTNSAPLMRSLCLLFPFIGVSFGLWIYNRYPASIFVGDCYTYFAGTVLAVAAISGVYGKTLLLFFIPQMFNFLISIPQLIGVVVCPRHRIPLWDPTTDELRSSGNYTILNVILVLRGKMHESCLTRWVLGIQVFACIVGLLFRYVFAAVLYEVLN